MRKILWSAFVLVVTASSASAQEAAASATSQAPGQTAPAPPPETAPSKIYTITTGLDFTSAYLFRGITQESGGAIGQPYADLGVTLGRGVSFNVGTWDSIHSTADVGNWYESDYYGSVTFTAGKLKPGLLYTSYTSPADRFSTVHELAGVVAVDDSGSGFPLAPKVVLAFELADGQADGGQNKGIYLELGVKPSFKIAPRLSLYIPVRTGLSVKDYYEGPNGDDTFGYFTSGFQFSVPAISGSSGTFEIHAGMDFQVLGDNLKLLNEDNRMKPIGTIGFTYTY